MSEFELLQGGKDIILSRGSSSGMEITLQGEAAIYSRGIPRTDSSTVASSEFKAGVLKSKEKKKYLENFIINKFILTFQKKKTLNCFKHFKDNSTYVLIMTKTEKYRQGIHLIKKSSDKKKTYQYYKKILWNNFKII